MHWFINRSYVESGQPAISDRIQSEPPFKQTMDGTPEGRTTSQHRLIARAGAQTRRRMERLMLKAATPSSRSVRALATAGRFPIRIVTLPERQRGAVLSRAARSVRRPAA